VKELFGSADLFLAKEIEILLWISFCTLRHVFQHLESSS
jgi:hypothetical protein